MSPPLLDTIESAKVLAMEGKSAQDIATALDLHITAATRIVDECEAHKDNVRPVDNDIRSGDRVKINYRMRPCSGKARVRLGTVTKADRDIAVVAWDGLACKKTFATKFLIRVQE